MKTKVNSPVGSKINWTSLVVLLIGMATALDYIPKEIEEYLVEITLIVSPVLVMTFRTWFTEPKG